MYHTTLRQLILNHLVSTFTLGLVFCNAAVTQNVGIGTQTPHSSARLHVADTAKGVLTPRMTQTQRNNISSPAQGLLIYQTNNNPGYYYYDGIQWLRITDLVQSNATLSGAGTAASPLSLAQQGATPGQVLKWNGTSWTPANDSFVLNTDTQNLGYNNLSAPTSNYVNHEITITNGNSVNIRDYYDPDTDTDVNGCAGCLDIGAEVNGAATSARLAGDGSSGSPLDIAQQGALTGQVLKWDGSSWAPASNNTNQLYSTTDNLSDISVYEDATNTGSVTLVNVTGSGNLLGGVVTGYYPKDAGNNDNYQITITIDGNTFDFPSNAGAYSYANDANTDNSGNIPLPPIQFDSDLTIEYTAAGSSRRVWGIAYVKQ